MVNDIILGVISNDSADNGADDETANELIITTAMVMMHFSSWRRRWRLAMSLVSTIVIMHGVWSWCRSNAVGRALVSVARTNAVRGSLAMAGTAVVIAA